MHSGVAATGLTLAGELPLGAQKVSVLTHPLDRT